ncbi:MAG: hypothetical protein ABSF00_02590 [Candidatus Bathyarchaeia archaeon]|jgi:hypothetical protein
MEPLVYRISGTFHKCLFVDERGVESLLLADRDPGNYPQRIFLVRYVIVEGAGAEGSRAVFKDELTGYDYEMKMLYPTQRVHLEGLQSTLEPSMYGSPGAQLSRVMAENISTKEQRPIKVVVSETLVAKLGGLYAYA